MSSREIAELTGKNYADVLRDVRVMLDQLSEVGSRFAGYYTASNGKQNFCFNLPKCETLVLVSGYSVELRARIMDRRMEVGGSGSVHHPGSS
ncbi:phage regulator Rha-like protein [Ensifer adhaerens]|uniref:Phage regulator Rha-like protein n=1 Tax=Ensifer adhaerens TaxID=106592 RepID=A0ACC5T3N7_ENSAD|nr:Rha family transcriptional regulator [Ensifer adhaerens]MBP1875730.1 phage regulator Rha-like protein [Ensifer adhaerens]